ncbi:MAG: hypothetical protein HYS13_07370 [Planctomycetia bacterium]|nr:hypothetical protein [Planctomycetia bacterium]
MTTQQRERMIRVRRDSPCPVCGRPAWCLVAADGATAICMRVRDGAAKILSMRDGQEGYLHRLTDAKPVAMPPPRRTSTAPRDFDDLSMRAFCCALAAPKRNALALSLGVSPDALRELRTGFATIDGRQGWTTPERDAAGKVIGLSVRLPVPDSQGRTKLRAAGSRCGLTYSPDWDRGGPVLLVEGASDVAAAITMELSAIGRPSNLAGVELLCEILRAVPWQREIVVIGERDEKPDRRGKLCPAECTGCQACWPGKYGAESTCRRLQVALQRSVQWAMPPAPAKDTRDWLNRCGLPWREAGPAFLQAVIPPEPPVIVRARRHAIEHRRLVAAGRAAP